MAFRVLALHVVTVANCYCEVARLGNGFFDGVADFGVIFANFSTSDAQVGRWGF
jgi:hypothetical protein